MPGTNDTKNEHAPQAPADVRTPQNSALAEEEDLEAQLAYENLKRRKEARKRKRIITIVVVAAIALGVIIWFAANQASNEEEDEDTSALPATSAVYEGEFSTTVSAKGATEPVQSTVVSPEVDGIVEGLSIQEGQHVEEGDVLFTLKNDELDKEVREAEAMLRKAENGVASAQREAENANREVDNAYEAYNRAVDQANAATPYVDEDGEEYDTTEFDEASLREAITSAESAYQTALEGIESAREEVESAQNSLDEVKAKADKRIVRAPVSGSVVSLSVENGQNTANGTNDSSGSGALLKISDLSQMKVTVMVNEVDISSIKEGQDAEATFSALPDVTLEAKVQRIASSSTGSDSMDGGGGVVTYAVDLLIPDPDKNLKPGMTATVTITTQHVDNALIVPTAALNGDEGDWSVSVVEDEESGKTRDVAVTVIEKNNSEAAVKGDLKDGDLVVLSGDSEGGLDGLEEMDLDSMSEEF